MTHLLSVIFTVCCLFVQAQPYDKLIIRGDYTKKDSIQIIEAYWKATDAVDQMYRGMQEIWNVDRDGDRSPKVLRKERWLDTQAFVQWLGRPEKMGSARRKIKRYRAKFKKKMILDVTKENKGRCKGWISAWAVPFGKLKIKLCEDFFIYRTNLQEKVLIHEVGHEIGILFHRRIHGCRSARRAAASDNNLAKRSTENYAWLAMSYLGKGCSF